MTNRLNSRQRKTPHRQQRSLILLVCGGEETEPSYFNGMRRWFRNPAVKVVVKGKKGDPETLVRYAARVRSENDYDEVWCVVDVDHFPLPGAVASAKKLGVKLAVSNPCFEYWLLLHFEDCQTPMTRYQEVERKLKKHVPTYRKDGVRFDDYAVGVESAVARAKSGCPADSHPHERTPSTSVWPIVEAMR
ncbi:RloB family protein [Amycolatopsis halotolerans]|uniref:RloB family protein n=1 Tax=Amycolatopsis halotolerans TaxID=330083 RepID=A0ABV7QH50_9PSEU